MQIFDSIPPIKCHQTLTREHTRLGISTYKAGGGLSRLQQQHSVTVRQQITIMSKPECLCPCLMKVLQTLMSTKSVLDLNEPAFNLSYQRVHRQDRVLPRSTTDSAAQIILDRGRFGETCRVR